MCLVFISKEKPLKKNVLNYAELPASFAVWTSASSFFFVAIKLHGILDFERMHLVAKIAVLIERNRPVFGFLELDLRFTRNDAHLLPSDRVPQGYCRRDDFISSDQMSLVRAGFLMWVSSQATASAGYVTACEIRTRG